MFLFGQTFAQETLTSDFFTQIKNYNLSVVIMADSIQDDGSDVFPRAEILGFIGDDFQRFDIHFISMVQNKSNPYEYFAYGKTKVKNIICEFKGTITVKEAKLDEKDSLEKYKYNKLNDVYEPDNSVTYKQGYVICEVALYEDQKQKNTGFIIGNLISNFLLDTKGKIQYDAYYAVGDGFSNNGFIGTWTSYKTGKSKKCNWGDYRIPESEDLDVGTGVFLINDKYVKNGWKNFVLAWQAYPDTHKVIKARQKEQEQWWK